MTEKLTAKLSDGREFEVVNDMPTAEGSENRVMWLKPIEPEPREWWAIKDTEWPNMYCFFGSLSEAEDYYASNKLRRSKPFLVREVV